MFQKRTVLIAAVLVAMIATELALQFFQSDQGRLPERLEQLAPQWLQLVPADPFSGQPLKYQPKGTNWVLYSTGTARVD